MTLASIDEVRSTRPMMYHVANGEDELDGEYTETQLQTAAPRQRSVDNAARVSRDSCSFAV